MLMMQQHEGDGAASMVDGEALMIDGNRRRRRELVEQQNSRATIMRGRNVAGCVYAYDEVEEGAVGEERRGLPKPASKAGMASMAS